MVVRPSTQTLATAMDPPTSLQETAPMRWTIIRPVNVPEEERSFEARTDTDTGLSKAEAANAKAEVDMVVVTDEIVMKAMEWRTPGMDHQHLEDDQDTHAVDLRLRWGEDMAAVEEGGTRMKRMRWVETCIMERATVSLAEVMGRDQSVEVIEVVMVAQAPCRRSSECDNLGGTSSLQSWMGMKVDVKVLDAVFIANVLYCKAGS